MDSMGIGYADIDLIDEEPLAGVLVLHVAGELDMATAPTLHDRLRADCGRGDLRHVVLDLTDVTFLGSIAASVLLQAEQEGRFAGPELHLVGVAESRAVDRSLNLLGLSPEFDIHSDTDALLRLLAPN